MKHTAILAAACGMFGLLAFTGAPQADERRAAKTYAQQGYAEPTKSRYSRKRSVRVRGYLVQRGGYYSYVDSDVIDTLEASRNLYRGTPFVGQQSPGGPFDSGFFFDSGMGPRWNDSPYPR